MSHNPQIQECDNNINYRLKIMEIGDWNMNDNETRSVPHGLNLSDIRTCSVSLRNDDSDIYYQMCGRDGAALSAQIHSIDNINVNLSRANGLDFQNSNFSKSEYNRGFIIIWYKD